MILRRLYLYLVGAAALGTLAAGLSALGFAVLPPAAYRLIPESDF